MGHTEKKNKYYTMSYKVGYYENKATVNIWNNLLDHSSDWGGRQELCL